MANKKRTQNTSKTSTKKSTTSQKKTEPTAPRLNKQGGAVILFAVALFLMCAAMIPAPDAALWNILHVVLLGVFGVSWKNE